MVVGLRSARAARGKTMAGFDIATSLYDDGDRVVERCAELGVTVLFRDAFCDERGMASKMTLDEKLRNMDEFASRRLR